MKKILLLVVILLPFAAMADQDTVRLLCKTGIETEPSMDPNVKESYDVVVKFLDDGAILTIDGVDYDLEQEYYDAPVAFYRMDPWYNLQIGNRNHSTKYALGIPSNEEFARYTSCEEIE